METIAHSEVRIITVEQAEKFLKNNIFRLQRKIKPRHLNSLVTSMQAGEFPPGTAICFARTTDSLELIDGQHRLRAQIEAKMSFEYTVTTIQCIDGKAVACLYTQFDIGARRTMVDRMKAIDVAAYSDLAPKQAQLLYTGAPYLKYRFGKMSPVQMNEMTPLQRLEILREYEEGAKLFFSTMESAEKWIQKVFMRPSFVALGSFLYQHAPEKAEYLWSAIANNNCGGLKDPRHYMFSLAQNSEAVNMSILKRVMVVLQAFIRGWNAMIEGREMSVKLNVAAFPAERVTILGVNDDMNPKDDDQANLLDAIEDAQAEIKNPEQVISDVMDQLSMAFPKEKPAGKHARNT